jgi:hypothetical protein
MVRRWWSLPGGAFFIDFIFDARHLFIQISTEFFDNLLLNIENITFPIENKKKKTFFTYQPPPNRK